jgi:hypothetical protein
LAEVLLGRKRHIFGLSAHRSAGLALDTRFCALDIAKAGAVNTVWEKARPKGCPGQAGELIMPS